MTTQAEVRGELTTKDLMRIGTGVSSRIFELRKEGYKIVPMREREGFYRYIYFGLITEDDSE